MRKLMMIAVTALLLAVSGAFAQDATLDQAPNGDSWVGLSTGYPFGFNVHYGLGDALGDGIDLRFNGNLGNVAAFGSSFGLGADALFAIPIEAEDVNVYAGGGPTVSFTTASGLGVSANSFAAGLQGIAGAEYLVSPEIGLFAELRALVGFINGFAVAPNVGIGANYHF